MANRLFLVEEITQCSSFKVKMIQQKRRLFATKGSALYAFFKELILLICDRYFLNIIDRFYICVELNLLCKLNFLGKKDKGLCWLFFSQVQEDLLHISSLLLLPRNIVVRCIVVLWIQLVDGWILSFPEMRTEDSGIGLQIAAQMVESFVISVVRLPAYIFYSMYSCVVMYTLQKTRKRDYNFIVVISFWW